jgi:hypothetical protein
MEKYALERGNEKVLVESEIYVSVIEENKESRGGR